MSVTDSIGSSSIMQKHTYPMPNACKPSGECTHLFQFVKDRSGVGTGARPRYGAAAHLEKCASSLPGLRRSKTAVRQAAAASPREWCRLLRSSVLPAGDASEWGTSMGRIVK